MRKKITLICTKCLTRNYDTTKNPSKEKRFEVKKYCPNCKEHTIHKETR